MVLDPYPGNPAILILKRETAWTAGKRRASCIN